MTFCQLHWFSQILRKRTTTWVLLPDTSTAPHPTFYLLHGLSDDYSAWMRWSRIESYAQEFPFIIVMPDGGRSFYTNHAAGPEWATHFAQELPDFIERTFPAKTSADSRHIGGLSMGGYGALRIALAHPNRYASVTSHSGALQGPNLQRGTITPEEFQQMIGPAYQGSSHDLTHIAHTARQTGHLPRIRIDCGTEDFLLEDNRRFHQSLISLAIPHDYQEFPGSHDWTYWDQHIQDALTFHAQ